MWNKEKEEEQQTFVYWCKNCKVPIIRPITDKGEKQYCSECGSLMKKLSKSVRPVFPAERELISLLTSKDLQNTSLWKGRVCYFNEDLAFKISDKEKLNADDNFLRKKLLNKKYDYSFFNKEIEKFIKFNKKHLDYITAEAINFIQEQSTNYGNNNKVVSFSGGKDSTVISDLVCKALDNEKIIHLFSDTTLESKFTIEYVNRLKKNTQIKLHIAKNSDNNFNEMAKKIGPPTMAGRWCCYMFKTGPINRVMSELFDGSVLSFLGVRRSESVKRQNYKRVENKTERIKIANQKVVAPILYWNDCEVWLYILANNLDFNELYRFGYNRAGCFCCPNSTISNELLERIYNHKKYTQWFNFLVCFSKQCDIKDPEVYVKSGNWKKRNGGAGIAAAKSVKIKTSVCTTEENAKVYELNKDITSNFYNLFIPFGILQKGRQQINETLILDCNTMAPIVSLQQLNNRKIKIVTLNATSPKTLHSKLAYQLIKYNACNQCLKCESLCKFGAISLHNNLYRIDKNKCKRCQICVSNKYLQGGCLMCRYLRTKKGADLI